MPYFGPQYPYLFSVFCFSAPFRIFLSTNSPYDQFPSTSTIPFSSGYRRHISSQCSLVRLTHRNPPVPPRSGVPKKDLDPRSHNLQKLIAEMPHHSSVSVSPPQSQKTRSPEVLR